MPIKDKDMKLLWGRSGNRCAICKIELTPDGAEETIGEMAHIVAQSSDGPRGAGELALEKRDEYSNLILLCPNHHKAIDKCYDKWSVSKIHDVKTEHERWVSERLSNGYMSPPPDNSRFLEEQKKKWRDFSGDNVWVICSITPLSVEGESVNPLDTQIINFINETKLPTGNDSLNQYDTRPDENGIINSRFNNGIGHNISMFRNGHCECMFCLEDSVRQVSNYYERQGNKPDCRVIRYTDLAEVIKEQILVLNNFWGKFLEFKNMTLTIYIENTNNTSLFSKETRFDGDLIGHPITSKNLTHSLILDKDFNPAIFIENVLKRFVNYFGLVLDRVYDDKGEFCRPNKLRLH